MRLRSRMTEVEVRAPYDSGVFAESLRTMARGGGSMSLRRVVNGFLVWLVLMAACGAARASEFRGQVVFGGLPLPGSQVTVVATQGDKKEVAISDDQGDFSFSDLTDGTWHLDIEMTGFAPLKTDITVPTVVTA